MNDVQVIRQRAAALVRQHGRDVAARIKAVQVLMAEHGLSDASALQYWNLAKRGKYGTIGGGAVGCVAAGDTGYCGGGDNGSVD